jgi:phosphoglycolate phosphatase
MAHILPDLDPARYPEISSRYRHHYLSRGSDAALFPGADETVRQLHEAGFLLAVATGKSRSGLDRALESTGLARYFHATRCADEGHAKPHPGMLEALMNSLGVTAGRTLMIGDTTHDMAMAQAAGVARLAAAYGAHARHDLLAFEPVACVDEFAQLRDWLLAHA